MPFGRPKEKFVLKTGSGSELMEESLNIRTRRRTWQLRLILLFLCGTYSSSSQVLLFLLMLPSESLKYLRRLELFWECLSFSLQPGITTAPTPDLRIRCWQAPPPQIPSSERPEPGNGLDRYGFSFSARFKINTSQVQ